jgi:acyl carrier protein
MMDVKTIIREFIKSDLVEGGGPATIGDGDSLIDAGIIDSLGIQRLIAFMEKQFSIKIADEDIVPENFESVETISNFIQAKG